MPSSVQSILKKLATDQRNYLVTIRYYVRDAIHPYEHDRAELVCYSGTTITYSPIGRKIATSLLKTGRLVTIKGDAGNGIFRLVDDKS